MYLNFIQINESSICEAFCDFMEYLEESKFTLSEKETLEYMENMFCL